mgnify:CR=1 FL=1
MKIFKPILLLLIMLLVFMPLSAQEDQGSPLPASVVKAVEKGDAAAIDAFIDEKVELVIPGKSGVFSKEQAHFILKEFFKENQVQSFEMLHHGTRQNATFAIGRYTCTKEKYRMYFLVKNTEDQPVIHQIRIEKQDE